MLINDEVGGGGGGEGTTQPEESPFNTRASNSTSPFENWNFTALSKVTAATVILFGPSVIGIAGPKNQFPFAVVFATLKLAPLAVSVTFIVKV